jgi:hypothetical protein
MMKVIRILVPLSVTVLCCLVLPVNASSTQSVLTGDFERNGMPSKFIYRNTKYGLSIDYRSSSFNKTLSYIVPKYDECSSMAIYAVSNVNQVVIDGSCSSQGGQIYKYVYEWKKKFSNWCLVREITGENADITSGSATPTVQVARVSACSTIGVAGPYKYESDPETKNEIGNELDKFRAVSNDKSAIKKYLDLFPSYGVYELVSYISIYNVQVINDMAFYLSKNARSYEAIPILEKIVRKFPGRVVAKLNLADAYWNNDLKNLATPMYKEYSIQMTSSGLQKKIPARVQERITN